MFFKVPGVIFDFVSLSFQVPISESAAKDAAIPKKQNATVNPIVLIFMFSIETELRISVNIFPGEVTEGQRPIHTGQSKRATITTAPIKPRVEETLRSVLLLVVNRDVLELFAFRRSSGNGGSAAFAVDRDYSVGRRGDFPVFLNGYVQGPIVHLRVGAGVSVRVASNGIIFSVELARPLNMDGFTVRADAVVSHFYLPEHVLEGHRGEFRCPGCYLRFGFVQLPSAHARVGGQARYSSQKAKRQS